MLERLYSALPIWMQDQCVTLQGARYYHWRYGGIFPEYLDFLQRTEYLSAERLAEMQQRKLTDLRDLALSHVPYYRKNGTDDFTTKDQVRERAADFVSDLYARQALIPWHTSGTTGKPLTVYYSRRAMQRVWAFVELYRHTAGVSRKDRRAQFTGRMIVPPQQPAAKKIFWRRDRTNRALLLSTVHLSPGNLSSYASALERFRPVYLCGYPSAMYVLACHYRESQTNAPALKAALTSAETLLNHQRKTIEEVFATRVFDQYGQAEMQSFWCECEYGRMHTHPLAGITEIVRPDGTSAEPGELGEVVLTGLMNDAMPLFRYRVGDTARFSQIHCPCGRGMPVIEEIGGRLDDFIYTRERGWLGRLDPALKGVPNIIESQIEQESPDALRVRFTPARNFCNDDLRKLETNLRAYLGRTIHLEFECTKNIPRSANGKFRFVISRLDRRVQKSCASSRG